MDQPPTRGRGLWEQWISAWVVLADERPSLPGRLAVFGAYAGLAGGLVFPVAVLVANETLGRPSSTSAVGFVFLPFLLPPFGAACSAGGAVIGGIAGLILPRTLASPLSGVRALRGSAWLGACLGIAVALGGLLSDEYEARPRILVSQPEVQRESGGSPVFLNSAATILAESGQPKGVMVAGKAVVSVDPHGTGFEVISDGTRSPLISVPALEGTLVVRGLHGADATGRPWLGFLADGRATGRRSAVVLLSSDLKVIHLEVLDRCWRADAVFGTVPYPGGRGECAAVVHACMSSVRVCIGQRP